MANSVSVDALRQELWSKELFDDVQRDVQNIMRFMGEGPNNIVQVSRELKKKKGDVETFGLIARLAGDGVTGDSELEGNEEQQLSYSEQCAIDQIRNAVRLTGKLDAQKVVYDQIAEAREQLRVWMKEYLARQIFLKLGGVTNTALVDTEGATYSARALWSNTPDFIPNADETAGVGNRYLCANSGGTDVMSASDKLTLDLITKAVTKAKLASPKIQPLSADGEDFYVLYVHPLQARDLRQSPDWKDAQQLAQRRGDDNPVFRGSLGYWSGALILENEYVPWLDVSELGSGSKSFRGASGADGIVDTARALLCGRQAVLFAEASNPESLVIETFDYGNKDGVAAGFIGGVQKAMFNSKEFGVIAVDSAAAE